MAVHTHADDDSYTRNSCFLDQSKAKLLKALTTEYSYVGTQVLKKSAHPYTSLYTFNYHDSNFNTV